MSFLTEDCPVCGKDEQIRRLDLVRRFQMAFIYWSLDYLRLTHYEGFDKQERENKMEKILLEVSSPSTSIEQMVQILEAYCEQRKSLSWK